jgi:hypothetical protein
MLGVLIGSTPANPPTQEQQQQYAAAKARYVQAVAGKLADADPNYSAYPDQNADKCYYAKHHDSADLCAQWRAAIAAEYAARSTFWTFVVSVAGAALSAVALVGLLLSLRQTEKSLGEARAANKIASDNAMRESRAYVAAIDFHVTNFASGEIPNISWKIENFGKSIAHGVEAVIGRFVTPSNDQRIRFSHTFTLKRDLAPGEQWEIRIPWTFALTDDMVLRHAHLVDVYIYAGIIRYRDAFGKRRYTTFKRSVALQNMSGNAEGPLLVCIRGNRSN